MLETAEIMQKRDAFFSLHFPDILRLKDNDYALYEAHIISRSYAQAIRDAATDAWNIYQKMFGLLCAFPDKALMQLGIPGEAVSCARIRYEGINNVVGRFDFIVTSDGPKMIEFNAETPFFIWESHCVSGSVAKHFGLLDPNEGAESHLRDAFGRALQACHAGGRLVVAGLKDMEESFTARYIKDVIQAAGANVDFAVMHELRIYDHGLYDARGKIDTLYRFYPMELIALEKNGEKFLRLLENDLLRVMNPPSSLLLQNKATQALIWTFYEKSDFFTAEERDIIARVFLPTYAVLPHDAYDYVRKPIFGREGNSIAVLRRDGSVKESLHRDYVQQPCVYQRRVDLPKVAYTHPRNGKAQGYAIATCFVAGGKATAIGMRVGDEITDAWAHFLPLACEA